MGIFDEVKKLFGLAQQDQAPKEEKKMAAKADIAVVGMAVMGQNLALNMNDHGFAVAVFNRTAAVTQAFLAGPARDRNSIYAAESLAEFINLLAKPRKVMLMVKAGA